jgi:hypothetical protein
VKAREQHETTSVFSVRICSDELGRGCRSVLLD